MAHAIASVIFIGAVIVIWFIPRTEHDDKNKS